MRAAEPLVTSFLFSLLFLVMGFFFLFIAGWTVYGFYRLLRAGEESRKYLAASGDDAPLQVEHLPDPLRLWAHDTRLLRISLDAPAKQLAELARREFNTTADDLEAVDTMLMNVSRQLTDWVIAADHLPENERATLVDVGATSERVRRLLDEEGWSFERHNPMRKHLPGLDAQLRTIIAELARIELALQTSPRFYR